MVWKTFYRNRICKSSFYMAFLFECLIEIIFSGLTKVCFTTKQTPKYAENVFQEKHFISKQMEPKDAQVFV